MLKIVYQLKVYKSLNGKTPFIDWLNKLVDQRAKQKIQATLDRATLGNLGKMRSLGEGVHELKITYGPGYRIYFGREDSELIILLCGGDKSTQYEDIKKAKTYWQDYKKKT